MGPGMSMPLPCDRSLLRAAVQSMAIHPNSLKMESGVFYGYQNRYAPNLDSSDKNPPMSYPLPEATPQMKSEQLLAVDPQGTVRSISPSGYVNFSILYFHHVHVCAPRMCFLISPGVWFADGFVDWPCWGCAISQKLDQSLASSL